MEHGTGRDDTERSLGIARRGQGRLPDAPASDGGDAISDGLWLGLIVFVAVAARLLVFILGPAGDIERAMDASSRVYVQQSVHLMEHGVFSAESAGTMAAAGAAEVASAPEPAPEPGPGWPGYALVLAGAGWLGLPMEVVLLMQVALGAAVAVLVYGIAMALFQQSTPALLAAGVAAVHPAGVVAANTLSPSTLLVALLLLGLYVTVSRRHHDFTGALLGGLALGAAALVWPVSMLLGAASALWVAVSDRRWAGVTAAAVLALASLMPAGVWMVRNHRAQLPRWPAPIAGQLPGLAVASDPAALASRATELFTAHAVDDLYERLGLGTPSPTIQAAPMANPATAATLARTRNGAAWLALAWSGLNTVLLLAALIGLLLLAMRGQWSTWLLLGGLMAYCLLAWPGTDAATWHGPIVGVQAVAGAVAWVRMPRRESRLRRWWRNRREQPVEDDDAAQIIPILTGRPL